jgi:hypothetical protein
MPSINVPSDESNLVTWGARATIRQVPLSGFAGIEPEGAGGVDVIPPVSPDCGFELTIRQR